MAFLIASQEGLKGIVMCVGGGGPGLGKMFGYSCGRLDNFLVCLLAYQCANDVSFR